MYHPGDRLVRAFTFLTVMAGASGHLPAARADENLFADLSFDKALAQAEQERKVVFIDFMATWCMPCKMLDQQTWSDAKVAAWLKEKTVPIKVDIDQAAALAQRFRVESVPTLVFVKPDGSEMDRIARFIAPADFLTEAEAILSGKDALTRAREKLEAAGADNPMARMEYARTLAAEGKYADALKEFLWCYDEGDKHNIGFLGIRVSLLLNDLKRLGDQYPPALDALRERRDQTREKVLQPEADIVHILEFVNLNRVLETEDDSLTLYEKLKQERPDSASLTKLREELLDPLREKHRYAELYGGLDLQARIDQTFEYAEPSRFDTMFDSQVQLSKEQRAMMEKAFRRRLLDEIGKYYEILLGSGHGEEADALAERLLAFDSSPEAYNILAWSGYLTGQPIEANLAQARKAYELSQGQSPGIVDTLARLLDAFDQQAEAQTLLEKTLAETTDPFARQELRQTLTELGGSAPAGGLHPLMIVGIALAVFVIVFALLARRRQTTNAELQEPQPPSQREE